MDEPLLTCTVGIILLTVVSSLVGFRDPAFREKFLFGVFEVLALKQHYRLITSAFLHADGPHLGMNMLGLYLFGAGIERAFGIGQFLVIYFAAIIGGNLLCLWLHRHHEYRAYGASGGVCGIVFSFVLLYPNAMIYKMLLPIPLPAWLYAILFLIGSFFALKRQTDCVAHDAHLGGAVIGLLTTAALHPALVRHNPLMFAGLCGISALLFTYFVMNPQFLPISAFLPGRLTDKTRVRELPRYKREPLQVDAVLEKISQKGIDSLTSEEKALLGDVSAKYQSRGQSEKPKSDLII